MGPNRQRRGAECGSAATERSRAERRRSIIERYGARRRAGARTVYAHARRERDRLLKDRRIVT